MIIASMERRLTGETSHNLGSFAAISSPGSDLWNSELSPIAALDH